MISHEKSVSVSVWWRGKSKHQHLTICMEFKVKRLLCWWTKNLYFSMLDYFGYFFFVNSESSQMIQCYQHNAQLELNFKSKTKHKISKPIVRYWIDQCTWRMIVWVYVISHLASVRCWTTAHWVWSLNKCWITMKAFFWSRHAIRCAYIERILHNANWIAWVKNDHSEQWWWWRQRRQ